MTVDDFTRLASSLGVRTIHFLDGPGGKILYEMSNKTTGSFDSFTEFADQLLDEEARRAGWI
jgi:hypothetical protein